MNYKINYMTGGLRLLIDDEKHLAALADFLSSPPFSATELRYVYPFDEQWCSIYLENTDSTLSAVQLASILFGRVEQYIKLNDL